MGNVSLCTDWWQHPHDSREDLKCRPAFTYSSHSQGSSTIHRHILLSVRVSNNYFLLAMATTQTNLGYLSPPAAKVFSYLKFRATALEGLDNKMQGLSVHNEAKVACSFPKLFAGTTASTWTAFTRT